jgi:hypothetical protein
MNKGLMVAAVVAAGVALSGCQMSNVGAGLGGLGGAAAGVFGGSKIGQGKGRKAAMLGGGLLGALGGAFVGNTLGKPYDNANAIRGNAVRLDQHGRMINQNGQRIDRNGRLIRDNQVRLEERQNFGGNRTYYGGQPQYQQPIVRCKIVNNYTICNSR